MINSKGDVHVPRASKMATEAEVGEDSCFNVPVLLHPHTEALADLLMPGLGNLHEKDTNGAHPLWQQNSRAKDAASRPPQQQTPTPTSLQGNENSAALGRWVSPPAVASLREQARHLQQQRHAKACQGMPCQQMMLDVSLGHFELPRGALQPQSAYQNKLPLIDNNRSFTLVGATCSTPLCQGSKEFTAAPATSSAPPHRRDPDGGVVVPIHLMASLLIKDSFTELSSHAQRRAGVGFGSAGSAGNDDTGVDEAMQTAAWQSPSYGEIPPNEDDGAVLGAISNVRDAAQDVPPVLIGAVGDPGASGTAGTGTAVVAGNQNGHRWPAPSVPGICLDVPLPHDMSFKAAAGGLDVCGGIQWLSSASQQLQQGQQTLRQSPQRMLDACCPSGSQPPLNSETSEEGFEQQRHMPSLAGFHTSVAASPHGPRWLSFTLQHRSEEKEGKEGDGAMLIDTRAAQGVPEGALLPTPERPRAPNGIGSWDALRGITFSTGALDTDGRAGARNALGSGDGVLGTLALLSPGLREDDAVGSDAAMAEPLAGSEPGRSRVGEVGDGLQTTEQGKELLKPRTGVAQAVESLEGEDGFDADDEGEGLAGTREERGARAASKLTGHSVRWRPLPGLEASPPWSPQRSSTAASHHSAAPSPQRHGFPSFASLALALPSSTHMPPRNTGKTPPGQELASSRPPIPRTVAPAAPTPAAAATGVASLGASAAAAAGVRSVVLPEDLPGHYNAADGEAEREALEEALKLKCSLRRAVQSQNPKAMGLVLSLLAALPFTPQMLADSQVAALVSPLQFNSNTEVANAARHLTAGWKGVLKAASRRSLAAQMSTREQTQQQQQLGHNHQLEWPQLRRPLRGSLRLIPDHLTTAVIEDVHPCNHHPHHRQQQQMMDVHIRDQAGRNRVHLNPSSQGQQYWHPHHYPRATALGEELLAPHDLSLQSLSLGRCRSDVLTKSVATGAAAVARAGSVPDSVAAPGAAAVSDAAAAPHPSAAAQTKRGTGGFPTQACLRPHPAGLRVQVQLTPLQSPQAPQMSPGAEAPIATLGTDQARHEGDAAQLPRRMPLVAVAIGKSTPSGSRTVSEAEAEAEVCSSGENRQRGARSCPGGWDLVRAGAASPDIADLHDARLERSMSFGAAHMDCMPSCSPLPTPSAVAVAAPGGSRGSDDAPHSRTYPFARNAVVLGDVTAGHIPLGSLSLGAGVAHVTPAVSVPRPGKNATCPQQAVASPTSGMTQPTPPAPHCNISSPAALPLAAAGMIVGGRSAAVRPLPPPSALGQTTGRKRKVERPPSRRRSGNPCKRPASSAKMGQLGPGEPSGSIYPGGLSRGALPNAGIGTSGDTASDVQRYLLPAGGLVAGIKTPARSSLLGLHPPPSKRQRHHSGFGSGASLASHGCGGAAQVRRVSILLSSLDLGSAGNGVEDEATEASGEMDATGVGTAAVGAATDLDADADMGSQDDDAAMLTSANDLLPDIEPCAGGAVGCPSSGERQELGPTERKGKGALEGGETPMPSRGLLSGFVMGIGICNGTNGLHNQAAGPGDMGAAAPAGGCVGGQAVVGDGCKSEPEPEAAGLPLLPSFSS